MAKGKRVSNKSGGDPGRRARKTGLRAYQNVARRLAFEGKRMAPIEIPFGMGKGAPVIKKPPVIRRAISRVKGLFSRGNR